MRTARTEKRDVLADMAAPLEPAREPYYVWLSDDEHPAAGWYWTPAGLAVPIFLGGNSRAAMRALLAAGAKL